MYIKVRVTAGAKREEVIKVKENEYHISVRQKAERNMANERVLEIIRTIFGGERVKVRIISGHHSPSKIISVDTE